MSYLRGKSESKSSYIESLCKTFDLSAATDFSSFYNLKNKNETKGASTTPLQQEPCKKCAKIRSSVKKFFRSNFETETSDAGRNKTSLAEQPTQMHTLEEERHRNTVSESLRSSLTCFGCDQQKRESSIRGPPIISPVCTGNIKACPLGEVFKNYPERVKKVIKIDRPRSLGPRKRMVDKEQYTETSVHETRKPSGR